MKDKALASSLLFFTAALLFVFFLVYRIALVFYPMQDAGGVEGNIIYFIQRILDGHALYTDPEKAPYAIAQYAPFYYFIVSGIARLFRISPDDLLQLYTINRSTGLLFNLGFLWLVYRMSGKIFRIPGKMAFIIAATAFVCLEISSFGRPDSLYHVLFLSSVFIFMRGVQQTTEQNIPLKYLLMSGIVAATALFAKQTAIVLPIVLCGWLLYNRRYRSIFIFSGSYLIVVSALLLCIALTGDIELFYKNVVSGVNNGINAGWYISAIIYPFYFKTGLFFSLLFVLLIVMLRKIKEPLISFSLFLTATLFLLLNLVMLKNGSNPGYMTEWWTLLLILTGTFVYAERSALVNRVNLIPAALCCALMIWKTVAAHVPIRNTLSADARRAAFTYYERQRSLAEKLEKEIGNEKYTVFLNVYTPDNYLANLLFRHAVMPQMDIVILSSYPDAKYDYSDFDKAIYDGRIKWMISNVTGPQKQFFKLRLNQFDLLYTEAAFNIYRLKP